MLDILFLALFLLTPLIMFFLLKIAGEQLNHISMVNLVTIALFAFSVLGTFPLFYQLDAYRVATGVTDPELVLTVTFLSCANIIIFLLGVIFVRKVLLLTPVPIVSLQIKKLNQLRFISMLIVLLLVALVLYVCLLYTSDAADE